MYEVTNTPPPARKSSVRHNYSEIKDAALSTEGAVVVPDVSNTTVLSKHLNKKFPECKFQVYTHKGVCYVKAQIRRQ